MRACSLCSSGKAKLKSVRPSRKTGPAPGASRNPCVQAARRGPLLGRPHAGFLGLVPHLSSRQHPRKQRLRPIHCSARRQGSGHLRSRTSGKRPGPLWCEHTCNSKAQQETRLFLSPVATRTLCWHVSCKHRCPSRVHTGNVGQWGELRKYDELWQKVRRENLMILSRHFTASSHYK